MVFVASVASFFIFLWFFFFFKQKTAYEMRISDWSSDVCSSDLQRDIINPAPGVLRRPRYPAAHVSQHTGGIIFGFTGHGGCYRRSNDVPPAPKRPKKALDRKSTRLNSSH